MDDFSFFPRKIDPSRGTRLDDGSPNDNNRLEIGPTLLALEEFRAAGLTLPNLDAMRRFRWERLTRHIADRDYGALLMFDPLNIRYATDSSNMQLWNAHNPFRAVLLCADGHMVLFDYAKAKFIASFNPLIKDIRTGASMFYFAAGDRADDAASRFAGEVDAIIREHVPGNRRLAIDKIMTTGLRAFDALGYEIFEGEEVTEKCRSVKGPDEILAMRCACHACDNAVRRMEEAARPGLTENDIWAVLHAENIKRGGEWIETRLLASGPRTNPWFQECGPRVLCNNEVLAFDTDLVGTYGICVDMSRTWWIGDQAPRPDIVAAMQHALDHVEINTRMLAPGVPFRDLVHGGHVLAPQYQAMKYGSKMHGVGLCDEWPSIAYPDDVRDGAFDYELEPGMVLCVEALVAEEGGDFSIKLENQVLITDTGHETLTDYPFDERLLTGQA